MHLLRVETRTLEEGEAACDLGQSPGDILILSFSDSDLSLAAEAASRRAAPAMSLRLANLASLKHPYSVDLYLEKAAARARFVMIRLLGGLDFWRYGAEEFSRAAKAQGFSLAIVPGDANEDTRLDSISNLPAAELRRIHSAFQHGGIEEILSLLNVIEGRSGEAFPRQPPRESAALPAAGVFEAGCRQAGCAEGHALVLFYRAYMAAGDTSAIAALADALAARGLAVTALFVASLKDAEAAAFVADALARGAFDIVINTTGFAARLDNGASVLDQADAPVLQAIFAGSPQMQWRESPRGLGSSDLAMQVVLPELDGRLIACAVAFKEETPRRDDLEFSPRLHLSAPSRVNFAAELASNWVRLRKTPRALRKIACILPDYPRRQGRGGYAIGLDVPKSVASIASTLKEHGYEIPTLPPADEIIRCLEEGRAKVRFSLQDYRHALARMPPAFVASVEAAWGAAEEEARDDGFAFAIIRAGHLLIALQPDRGLPANRKSDYHDTALPPRHSYIAFYVWLRAQENVHAILHCGTHGTLEWLPGKAVALGEDCAPEAVLGPLPVIYPFIVNNPGEAAQAKRRTAALTIGHMTPLLMCAGNHGAAIEIESLFDEYASAQSLDPKRAARLAQAILAKAEGTGLLKDSGAEKASDPVEALRRLDAWLCDVKEMRIADGLHIFGQSPSSSMRDVMAQVLSEPCAHHAESKGADCAAILGLIDRCGPSECAALIAALDGRFVAPGPGGAPSRGRIDVLPTGRNIYGVDPRAVPTRTAWDIGQRAAEEVLARHLQDRGEWPKRIVMDLWASATMRTGGDDLAQALALLGAAPTHDHATSRVTGFEIIPHARLGRPRVDVTLRISGLFRDTFPAQIALFDQAVRAISLLEEENDINPLAAAWRANGPLIRIFGAPPGTYGIGLTQAIDADPMVSRQALGERYLDATSHGFSGPAADSMASDAFGRQVAAADAYVHVQDQDEQDILGMSEAADHEGGFAAAAQMLGNDTPLYHVETTRPGAIKVRTLKEEVARVVRGRAINPRWIEGQMRHGYRGAAEIAETIDNLYAMALLSDTVTSQHFELMFEATLGQPEVCDFLIDANPKAARAIACRFEDALARGFWRTRRNAPLARLAALREALP